VELGDRLRGFLHAALGQAGADHELQRSRALRPIIHRQTSEVALSEICGGCEISAIEYDTRAPERSERMGSTALEQRHGFVEPPLTPPQFSETHEPLPRHGRAACGELIGG